MEVSYSLFFIARSPWSPGQSALDKPVLSNGPSDTQHGQSDPARLLRAAVSLSAHPRHRRYPEQQTALLHLRHLAVHALLDSHHLWRCSLVGGRVCGRYAVAELEIAADVVDGASGLSDDFWTGSSLSRERDGLAVRDRTLRDWVVEILTGCSLGAIYEAGNFTMTTWMPLVWAVINILVVILSSFPMQGAL